MYRPAYHHQPFSTRLYSQRKLFLLVFLWTCLCLVIFRSSLFSGSAIQANSEELGNFQADDPANSKLFARSASSSAPAALAGQQFSSPAPIYLAPEFALPDNNALYYSLSSLSAPAPAPASSSAASVESPQASHLRQPASDSSSEANPAKKHSSKHQKSHGEHVPGAHCIYNYPTLSDLQFNNIHWQKFTTTDKRRSPANSTGAHQSEATYYLYNAYYDDRWRGGIPSVRILAMINRIAPPPTNCLLWSSKHIIKDQSNHDRPPLFVPLVSRASFVYAWYPKWGNYKDGLLQPWIVTCPMPREHVGLVPDSVSLVAVPPELAKVSTTESLLEWDNQFYEARSKRDLQSSSIQPASMAMPASFSSSSPAFNGNSQISGSGGSSSSNKKTTHQLIESASLASTTPIGAAKSYDCSRVRTITNNLPVFNQRPKVKGKFAVCVKGLDFPHEDVSVRLIEWIELLNLLGAGKIFLYNLDVHENISKVLNYYQKRGIVELSPLTLPGDQPNLPEYQHLYLKSRLTSKRQNELIPYNDCLYRNLNSYQYLALLDIDEIIMPMKWNHFNWYDLMEEVEQRSMSEQNYSRASYNVRNVYFFDDLAGPMGTTSSSSPESSVSDEGSSSSSGNKDDNLERGIPHYLHMMQHVYRSKNYTKPGQYVKCFHNTERVVSLHNHFPMNCFGQCTTYSIPVELAHLQHYRKDCVGPLKQSCKNDYRAFTTRDTTIWRYKQQMIKRTTRVLTHLGLLEAQQANR